MSTQYDIMTDLRTAIQGGSANALALSLFGKPLTVLLGYRKPESIKSEQLPAAIIMYAPETVEEQMTGTPFFLQEQYRVEIGVHSTNFETALQSLAAIEAAIATDILADRQRNGMATHSTIIDRVGDGSANHPFHFAGITLRVSRDAPY